jgi:cytochrome c oxidase subunit 2
VTSILDGAGLQAAETARLWWFLFALCASVYLLVMAMVLLAVRRRKPDGPAPSEARLLRVVVGASALTAAVVLVVLVASASTGRALAGLADDRGLVLNVTGHQWWWDVEYEDPEPSRRFHVANEIHIPVGVPVTLQLASNDVIHSLWVPSLHGKRDLVPGRRTSLSWHARRPGVYRGFCAEFCGHQHAHMGLLVVAQEPAEFEAWRAAQLQPATASAGSRGAEIFSSVGCGLCHTVRGTESSGRNGPDLTHLASRRTLGAVTLPNTPEGLARWIHDPQAPKPGNRMPASPMSDEDRAALVAWLQELR